LDLPSLLIALRPLLVEPAKHVKAISTKLAAHSHLAEFEVARAFVTRAFGPLVERLSTSQDPLDRAEAVRLVRLTYARSPAAKVLRVAVKDQDRRVRSAARRAVRTLRLDDVALPDTRNAPAKGSGKQNRNHIGGWNPTGWSFGIRFKHHRHRPRKSTALSSMRMKELLSLIGLRVEKDARRLMRPGHGAGSPYVSFEIPKATGGTRTILAPRQALKTVQRAILHGALESVPVHDACHGFVKGRSVLTNATPHQKAALLIKLDLKDFFPTIHYQRVVGLFTHLGFKEDLARLLAGLCTHRPVLDDGTVVWPGVLPQGAPTSPAIANLVCRRLDARLTALARTAGGVYTRYADDLTFSFQATPSRGIGRFLWWVDQICQQEGFIQNTTKRRVLRRSNQQRVTGVVVNSGLFVPREARRRFRAILENCRRNGIDGEARGQPAFRSYLQGFAAYVHMVQPELGKRLRAEVKALIAADKSRTPPGP
jgi:hypothetical protein